MATILRADGSTAHVEPRGDTFTLAELYEHTRCDSVQMVGLLCGCLMWGDESAYLRDPRPAPNRRATALYESAGGEHGWPVLGDVLLTASSEVE